MKSLISVVALMVAVASVGLQAEGRGLKSLLSKPDQEWQSIDSFIKDDASCEKINKHLEENQATMEPKLLADFKLVADVACMPLDKASCGESESLKVLRLFDSLDMEPDAQTRKLAEGVRKLAFRVRDDYVYTCSAKHASSIFDSLTKSVPNSLRNQVETFASSYGDQFGLAETTPFEPIGKNVFATAGYGRMGRALYETFRDSLPEREKQLDAKTGKKEHNWIEMIDQMKADCKAYVDAVKDPLVPIPKDTLVMRAFSLSRHAWHIQHAWLATLACDKLNELEADKVATKMANEASKAGPIIV